MDAFRYAAGVLGIGLLLTGSSVWGDVPNAEQPSAHIQASGTVTQVTPTAITLKTPHAQIVLNVNATVLSGFTHVKEGDELTVWLSEDNVVVDVHKKGDQRNHRLISGKLAYSDQAKTQMKLWTPEGLKTFPVKLGEARLQNIQEGTAVTVEIDEMGRMMDIHRN
jgi:hypothetical protein